MLNENYLLISKMRFDENVIPFIIEIIKVSFSNKNWKIRKRAIEIYQVNY